MVDIQDNVDTYKKFRNRNIQENVDLFKKNKNTFYKVLMTSDYFKYYVNNIEVDIKEYERIKNEINQQKGGSKNW